MQKNKAETINISISDDAVYANYAIEDKEVIDEMLVDALEKTANTKPISRKLEITFSTKQNVKIDADRFTSAYQNTMLNKIETKNMEIVRCLLTGFILLTVSICALLAFVYFFSIQNLFWNKFGEIVSWVFVWASVEIFTIELIQLLIEKAKAKRLLQAQLIITSKKKKE